MRLARSAFIEKKSIDESSSNARPSTISGYDEPFSIPHLF